jgi:two-component system cell cycle response regulator DivK
MKNKSTHNEQPLALVIEDDPDLAAIYSQAASAGGFNVLPILDGNDALSVLQTCQPDLILLDLHLPGASGGEILRYVRQQERLAGVKIVITTADASLAESMLADSDLILLKPISYNQLRDLAARLGRSA